ncbi:MAG TPA: alkaline phosphatase family protein [Acidimicrobiales bacterium]|nr:alkaline phosphatase family protein [Acidimicrobiales bacterium]
MATPPVSTDLILPDYGDACVSRVVASCLDPDGGAGAWLPDPLRGAEQVVLLVLDGLGWEQLTARSSIAPTLCAMEGGSITTVAPSTTSTALTSISTGTPPGQHGVIGYRIAVDHEVLNVLRWSTPAGDARKHILPESIQREPPFAGERPPVVTRAEFRGSGFTIAHLDGVRFTGYRTLGTLVAETQRHVDAGEPFVYVYYDGIDKVAHEYGFGPVYDAELRSVDRLVGDLLEVIGPQATLVVTADHGQVVVGDHVIELDHDVLANVAYQSGEGRFRWLHARSGRASALLSEAVSRYSDDAWVVSAEQIIEEGWFGPRVSDASAARLGDVALVARTAVAFHDPDDSGPYQLIARHGSLTAAEMYVPLLASRG